MIQSDLFSALSSTFSGRLYPMIAPAAVTRPFGVYSRVSDVPTTIHAGGAHETRIQIDIYAETYAGALSLAANATTAINAAGFSVAEINAMDEYEDDVKLYRVLLEFAFWQ